MADVTGPTSNDAPEAILLTHSRSLLEKLDKIHGGLSITINQLDADLLARLSEAQERYFIEGPSVIVAGSRQSIEGWNQTIRRLVWEECSRKSSHVLACSKSMVDSALKCVDDIFGYLSSKHREDLRCMASKHDKVLATARTAARLEVRDAILLDKCLLEETKKEMKRRHEEETRTLAQTFEGKPVSLSPGS